MKGVMLKQDLKIEIPVDLKLSSYDFELPDHFIAERPEQKRDECKLLVYSKSKDQIIHTTFKEIYKYIPEGTCLVKNQTKVLPCRLIGNKSTGAKCEVFILGPFGGTKKQNVLIKSSSKKHLHDHFNFPEGLTGKINSIIGDGTFEMEFNLDGDQFEDYLNQNAKIPIPPYIRGGESDTQDREDYQTIYAANPGSVAAPTAGLHFTKEVLDKLESNGVINANVTLHVGLGTFSPVKVEDLRDHKMHSENFIVENEEWKKINSAKNIC